MKRNIFFNINKYYIHMSKSIEYYFFFQRIVILKIDILHCTSIKLIFIVFFVLIQIKNFSFIVLFMQKFVPDTIKLQIVL